MGFSLADLLQYTEQIDVGQEEAGCEIGDWGLREVACGGIAELVDFWTLRWWRWRCWR